MTQQMDYQKKTLADFASTYYGNEMIGESLRAIVSKYKAEDVESSVIKSVLEDEFYRITYYSYLESDLDKIKELFQEDWNYMQNELPIQENSRAPFEMGQLIYLVDLDAFCYLFF